MKCHTVTIAEESDKCERETWASKTHEELVGKFKSWFKYLRAMKDNPHTAHGWQKLDLFGWWNYDLTEGHHHHYQPTQRHDLNIFAQIRGQWYLCG